jgi:hypothetical protein
MKRLGGKLQRPREPGISIEDLLQHLATDAVTAPRPLASLKERHAVEAVGCERDMHMRHALGVISQLESQTVCAANEASRAGHRHEALATKLRKDRLSYSQVSHGSAPSDWPSWVA